MVENREPNYFDIPDLPGKGSLVDYFNGLGVSTPYGNLEAALDTVPGPPAGWLYRNRC